MPGYIGGAYDFSVEGEFDSATIRFEFDEALLADASFEPGIYYFNEDEQKLEALATTVNGNVASAQVTHFSKYILLNANIFEGVFKWKKVQEDSTGAEIVFLISVTSSIRSCDINEDRYRIAENLIEQLPDSCTFGVINYSDRISYMKYLTDDKEMAILNDNSLQVLNEFQKTMCDSGIEVWYRIAQ